MTAKIKVLVAADMTFLLLLALSGSAMGIASEILYYLAFIIPIVMMLNYAYKTSENAHTLQKQNEIISDIKKSFSLSRGALKISLPLIFPSVLLTLFVSLIISLTLASFGFENASDISSPFAIALITHALVPAVLEELLFRFAPIALLSDNKKTALILSSVMFAFAHVSLFQIPYAILAGFILCALYLATGSILPSMVLHFINNAISLISIYGIISDGLIILILASLSLISAAFIFAYRRSIAASLKQTLSGKKLELSYHPLFFIITSLVLAISSLFA